MTILPIKWSQQSGRWFTNQFFFRSSGVRWGGVYAPTFVYIHLWNTSYMHDDLGILVPGVLFSAGLGAFN